MAHLIPFSPQIERSFAAASAARTRTTHGPIAKVEGKVRDILDDHPNMARHDAFAQVMRENPELRAAYVEAMRASQGGGDD